MGQSETVVLITGANRGIGRAFVEAYLAAGAKKIYAGARNVDDLKPLVALDPTKILPVKLDITDKDQVAAAASSATDVNTLINNAGAAGWGALTGYALADDDINLKVNLFGTISVTQAFAPVLKNNGGGVIANVLSVVSLGNASSGAVYSISKAAAWSATQAFRADLAKDNIKVVGVFPGPIDTEMAAGLDIPKTAPAEVANAVIAGIADGADDIFPDPMAKQIESVWKSDPAGVSALFASLG